MTPLRKISVGLLIALFAGAAGFVLFSSGHFPTKKKTPAEAAENGAERGNERRGTTHPAVPAGAGFGADGGNAFPNGIPPLDGDFSADGVAFDGAEVRFEKKSERTDSGGHKIFLGNGDLFDTYGGGREYLPERKADGRRDDRVWIDARVPLEISSRLKLYGVSTLTLGNVSSETMDDYARNYGLGGGFGISYRILPNAELNFDFRRTRTLETSREDEDPTTDSAGISLKLKF